MGNGNDGWDTFDWNAWGAADDGRSPDDEASKLLRFPERGAEQDEVEVGEDGEATGQWVTSGGVVHWEEPDAIGEPDPRAEATSAWAADDVELPLGAPDALRVRAAHAWLARQRTLENDAMGILLVERRRLHEGGMPEEDGPLDLELSEHQAALEAYEDMMEQLDEIAQHSGPARVLVEFHLWLTEQLAALASAPEAPEDFAPGILLAHRERQPARTAPDPRAEAEWRGRVEAVMQARRRVEQVSAPEPEE